MLEGVGGSYEQHLAEAYDGMFLAAFQQDTAGAVAFLEDLAGKGPALELGIGTGRVALALADTGVEVHGIDSSEHMLRILSGKPGGGALSVVQGTMADFALEERFPLIYAVFNTFFSLLTQDEQVACFECVARHLEPGGTFVMQAFVPDPASFERTHQRISVESTSAEDLQVDATTHDPVEQRVDNLHVLVHEGKVTLFPVKIRYTHVSELDLMARIAGLRLRERWADWDRSEFPSAKGNHISVWERAG